MILRILSALGLAALAACASSASTSNQRSASMDAQGRLRPMASQTEAPDLGALPVYGIPKGRCGMVLYTLSGATPVPIFRSTDDGAGLIELEGAMTTLDLVGRGGDTRMSVPSTQYFRGQTSAGTLVSVVAATTWGATFPGGSYVESGTMTVKAEDGWSRVIPVAGIAGCKP